MSLLFQSSVRAGALYLAIALPGAAYGRTPPQETTPAAPEQAAAPASDFAAVRQLSESGKHDEALAKLRQLRTNNPSLRGLDREFGIIEYKKGDYLEAINSLKKALAADASDNEATQILGLSSYLAGRPAR